MANAKHLCKINAKRPEIKHPLSRLGNPQTLSVRGVSRADGWKDSPGTEKSPKQAENLLNTLTNDRIDQLDSWKSLDCWVNLDKKYLEKNGKEEKENTHKYDNTQYEVQCEELEYQLLEKINYGGFYDLKHLFLSSDPEHRGRVRRDALLVILTTFLGRYISDPQFHHLLQRLELGDKQVITFDAFYDYFKKPEINDPPEWLDPLKRKKKLVMKTANQVHLDLKEVASTSYFELLKLFPKDRLNSSGFCAALSKLGISMTEKEFDKLWNRYVKEAEGSLDIEELLCNLGVKSARDKNEHCGQLLLSGIEKVTGSQQTQQTKTNKTVLSKMDAEKKQSLSIEKWLKEKFREGARSMVTEFLVYDTDNSSKVLKEDFLKVLGEFQLHLTGEQLDQFLVRCGLNERSPFINYQEFLQRLQSRSKNALSYTLLWRTGHRFGEKKASHVLEDKLLRLFHDDFISLLQSFKKADIKQLNVISPQDFRSIIEAKYCIKLSDEHFECLVGKLPLDGHGSIRYLEFMAKFDSSSEGRLSIFDDSKTILTDYSRNANVKNMRCKGKKATQKERTAEQLTEIIKNIVKNNYGSLESAFNQIDAMNTRRLTLESIYQLLKRCDIDPPISRKETSKLWQSFILNQDKTVDYYQFVRHFGFSMKSSCFPNAKISPPIKGDVDFMIRSRKLNSDTKIIANILQAKVEISVEDLWNLFKELDPSNSGCVTTEEFIDILQDLSPDLSKHQCDSLVAKFAHGKDRISYATFLKPYQSHRPMYKQNINKEEKAIQQGLNTITSKFRQKLSSTEWKNLHKACQKMDANGSGFLLLPEFRSVVKLCNMVLDEDDIYHIMSHYDKDLAGKINYSKLVSDHSKINRKES